MLFLESQTAKTMRAKSPGSWRWPWNVTAVKYGLLMFFVFSLIHRRYSCTKKIMTKRVLFSRLLYSDGSSCLSYMALFLLWLGETNSKQVSSFLEALKWPVPFVSYLNKDLRYPFQMKMTSKRTSLLSRFLFFDSLFPLTFHDWCVIFKTPPPPNFF